MDSQTYFVMHLTYYNRVDFRIDIWVSQSAYYKSLKHINPFRKEQSFSDGLAKLSNIWHSFDEAIWLTVPIGVLIYIDIFASKISIMRLLYYR